MGSTKIAKNEGKRRSDMEYFDSLFRSLSPIRYQEVDWAKQGYTSINSAANSIRAAANKRKINGVNVRMVKDRLFVYSDSFLNVLPLEKDVDLDTAFKRADRCLKKYADITAWPLPSHLIPYDMCGDTRFITMMRVRDALKAKYPYLTIKATDADIDPFAICRDKSYGNLCAEQEPEKEPDTKIADDADVMLVSENVGEDIADEVPESSERMRQHMPALPFKLACEISEYLCSNGYLVSMRVFNLADDRTQCVATVSYE